MKSHLWTAAFPSARGPRPPAHIPPVSRAGISLSRREGRSRSLGCCDTRRATCADREPRPEGKRVAHPQGWARGRPPVPAAAHAPGTGGGGANQHTTPPNIPPAAHTITRWANRERQRIRDRRRLRRTAQAAAVVGVVGVGYVLYASLVSTLLADALGVAAALLAGAS